MATPRALGQTVVEGDEVVASRWRRRWRRVRRQFQAGFLAGVVAVPLGFRVASPQDVWGPVTGFAVLVSLFTVAHLWAGARMWMKATQVTDQGIVATRVAKFVAPRRFVRWTEIESAAVEPWSSYGDRVVFKLRGGGALHTIPGELDEAAVKGVMGLLEASRSPGVSVGGRHAGP